MTTSKPNLENIPDDLSEKILNDLLASPRISITTLKNMSRMNKYIHDKIGKQLFVFSHKNVKFFCKLQNIGNILPIIKDSIFDFENLYNILLYIEDDKQIKNLFPLPLNSKISIKCMNATFVIFQLIKFHIVKCMKPHDVIDKLLFDFFDNIYTISKSASPKSKQSPNTRHISVEDFNSTNIDWHWHLVNFNIYYIYEIIRLHKENCKVRITKYNQFDKYVVSNNEDVMKKSIKYIIQQSQTFNNDIFIYIYSFIIFKICHRNINKNDTIIILYEEAEDTYKVRSTVGKIYELFKTKLYEINSTTSRNILEYAS